MGVHRRRRYLAAAATAWLAACTPNPGRVAGEKSHERTVPMEITDAPEGVAAAGEGPACRLRSRGSKRYAVEVLLTGRLTLPRDDARPVYYEVEVVAADRTYVGWVSGLPPRPHPETDSFWLLRPTPLNVAVADATLAPEDYLGIREVPVPLQSCRLRLTEPDKQEAATGRPLQTAEAGTPVVMDADGEVFVE